MSECQIFQDLYDNIVNNAGKRIADGLIPAEGGGAQGNGTWYCEHGLIAMLPGPNAGKSVPYHNVDPSLIGHVYETTTVADGT